MGSVDLPISEHVLLSLLSMAASNFGSMLFDGLLSFSMLNPNFTDRFDRFLEILTFLLIDS